MLEIWRRTNIGVDCKECGSKLETGELETEEIKETLKPVESLKVTPKVESKSDGHRLPVKRVSN